MLPSPAPWPDPAFLPTPPEPHERRPDGRGWVVALALAVVVLVAGSLTTVLVVRSRAGRDETSDTRSLSMSSGPVSSTTAPGDGTAGDGTTGATPGDPGSDAVPADVPAITGPMAVPASWRQVSDPSGVTFSAPPGWEVQPGSAGPIFVYVDGAGSTFRRNVNIMRQSVGDMTLKAYTELSERQLQASSMTGGTVHDAVLSGTPASQMAYRFDGPQGTMSALAIWTMRAGSAWLVTYVGDGDRFDAALPDVEILMSTVRVPD